MAPPSGAGEQQIRGMEKWARQNPEFQGAGGIGAAAREARDFWLGNENETGFFGTGQRGVKEQQVNTGAGNIANYDKWQQMFGQGAQNAANRQAPTAQAAQLGQAQGYGGATIDQSQQAQFRQGQVQLADMLMAQAQGHGPSLAQGQLQQATDRNLAQALAMANSASPAGGGAAMRNATMARAAASQQAAADSGLLRAQEQLGAQNQLGQVLAGARGLDIGLATDQARLQQEAGLFTADSANKFALQQGQFQQQANLANQDASLRQQAMNDQAVQYYLSQGLGLDEANRKAAMDMEKMRLESALGYEQLRNQAYGDAAGRRLQFTKMGADAASQGANGAGQGIMALAQSGALAALSDERGKTDIAPADAKLDGFLEALGAHEYSYKDEANGKGRRISPMAQEMEKSELGREFVFEREDGLKGVDYGKMAGTLLAGEARLAKRLKRLEEALGA